MILVFGKNGQVAQALDRDLKVWKNEFLASDVANFMDPKSIISILNDKMPSLVINASAYTAVDKAESEREMAHQINAITVGEIAQWCANSKVPFVHFSTDYVFDGKGTEPLDEDHLTNPVNYYGQTKLDGEELIKKVGGEYYIFRVAWVYAPWGKNFPKTILRLAQEKEEISIVNDQYGSPTDAREISMFVKLLISGDGKKLKLNRGVYHLSFKPFMTWYDLALKTIEEAKKAGHTLKVKKINPITTDRFPTPAKRPANSRLVTRFGEIQEGIERVKIIAKEKGWEFLS